MCDRLQFAAVAGCRVGFSGKLCGKIRARLRSAFPACTRCTAGCAAVLRTTGRFVNSSPANSEHCQLYGPKQQARRDLLYQIF